jgi:hypothetical protein
MFTAQTPTAPRVATMRGVQPSIHPKKAILAAASAEATPMQRLALHAGEALR